MTAVPKYATPRDPSARSDGWRIAQLAEALGRPLMPWQRYVADVATEREPDGSFRYETVLVTVPRQSGKTTLVGPVQLDRLIMTPGIKAFYTAQTGKDARSRFADLVKLIQASPLETFVRVRYSQGTESLSFPNGSTLQLFAPVAAALHGETPPLVTMDEIWEWDEPLGDAILEGAVIPAQMTLAGRRQRWLISTAGTAQSGFMRKWVERGRAGHPRMAYFEWSLPDGADPYDPDVFPLFHPAVGHTVTAQDLLEIGLGNGTDGGVSRATWLRAFCNLWTDAVEPIMSADAWAALEKPMDYVLPRDVVVAYDVAPDNASAAVVAAWREPDGTPCIRVLHSAPGTVWVHDFVANLFHSWGPKALAADDGGPTRRLTDELRRTLGQAPYGGDWITTTGSRDFPIACEALLTYAREGTLKHDGSRTFARAIQSLTLRRVGDVSRFSRSGSGGPVAGLVAAAVALWVFDHQEPAMEKPVIYTLGAA